MNKRLWFYTSITLFVILVVTVGAMLNRSCVFVSQKDTNLQNYLELSSENNFYSSGDSIPDARTAARVGGYIIDNMCDKNGLNFGHVTVEYDAANRLWKVTKSYGFTKGGFVIINQDTGEIIEALLQK